MWTGLAKNASISSLVGAPKVFKHDMKHPNNFETIEAFLCWLNCHVAEWLQSWYYCNYCGKSKATSLNTASAKEVFPNECSTDKQPEIALYPPKPELWEKTSKFKCLNVVFSTMMSYCDNEESSITFGVFPVLANILCSNHTEKVNVVMQQ